MKLITSLTHTHRKTRNKKIIWLKLFRVPCVEKSQGKQLKQGSPAKRRKDSKEGRYLRQNREFCGLPTDRKSWAPSLFLSQTSAITDIWVFQTIILYKQVHNQFGGFNIWGANGEREYIHPFRDKGMHTVNIRMQYNAPWKTTSHTFTLTKNGQRH